MTIERSDVGTVTVLRLIGDIDERGAEELRSGLYECMRNGRYNLVLNISQVGFISYMSVGVLVERLRKLRSCQGDLKLVGLNVYAERLFRMVGVSGLFETYDSESRAIGVYQEAA